MGEDQGRKQLEISTRYNRKLLYLILKKTVEKCECKSTRSLKDIVLNDVNFNRLKIFDKQFEY